MAVYAKDNSKEFPIAPPGTHIAVCVDVVDKGNVETPWGPKPKCVLIWEIDEHCEEYEGRFQVNKQYTISLHEKANLTQDLESWRGKAFSQEEKKGFDLERLIGVPCLLNVVHNTTDAGKTYANVKAIMPLPKDTKAFAASAGYVRVMDREGGWDVRSPQSTQAPEGGNGVASVEDSSTWNGDDALPF